jgi:hypothetical protein
MWNEFFGNMLFSLTHLTDEIKDKRPGEQVKTLQDIVAPCFDSFGLATTLIKFLDAVYYGTPANGDLIEFKSKILEKMCDLDYRYRFTIEQAHKEAQAFLARF